MKNIIKILFLFSILLLIFACPKDETTKPPTVYTNNIDVRFFGSWDLYTCNESGQTKYLYPVLMQKDYMVVSTDSLFINSLPYGEKDNHGVFFTDGQIWYKDKSDNLIYTYDYYYNTELNRLWLKTDSLSTRSFDYDPITNPQDSTLTVNDFILLYPSDQPPAPKLTIPQNNTQVGDLKPDLKWESYDNAENYIIQVSTDSLFEDTQALVFCDTITTTTYHLPENITNFSDYYWRVKANNSVWSAVYKFSTFYIVTLKKPNNAESVSRKPTIKWESYEGATEYTLQISLQPDFGNIAYEETLAETQYIPPTPLEAQKRYYWRVKSDNSEGYWSLTRSFITDNYVILQNPINGKTGVNVENIVFEWQEIENASSYHIQIADSLSEDDQLFNVIVDVDGLTDHSYISQNELQENKTYYWRVSSDVSGKWSYVFNFVTNNSVFLRNPENNAENITLIVKFEWDNLTENDTLYTLQISTDSDFNDYYEVTSQNTYKLVTEYLEGENEYYWRVKADHSNWSEVWHFSTTAVISGTASQIPANEATNIPQNVQFTWTEISNAAYYEIMVSEQEDFSTVVIDTVFAASDDNFITLLEPLEFGQTYYWKVRSDKTLWSAVNVFTIESGIPTNFIVEILSPLKFDISWTNTANQPLGYVLERWDSETDEWIELANESVLVKNTKNTYVDFDKDPNVYYKYRIKAVSESGDSDYALYPTEGDGVQPMELSDISIPELVDVTAGSFNMGSTSGDDDEAPIHNVTLTNNFKISKYEVSIKQFVQILNYSLGKGYIKSDAQYTGHFYTEIYYNYAPNAMSIKKLLVNSTPIEFDMDLHKFVCEEQDQNKPIYDITYFAAAMYCRSLNEIENYSGFYNFTASSVSSTPYEGEGYRLPTEAEWEYVAQYNDGRIYPWGDTEPDQEHANYYGSGWGNEPLDIDACPAGANQLGVYNLAGNVWEWCNDTFEEYPEEAVTDPTGASGNTTDSSYKIIRGSSCELGPNYLRNTNRSYCKANLEAGKVNSKIGFRIIKLQ